MAKEKQAQDVKLEAYTKGMQSNYSHYVASPNSWSFLENFDTDRQGVISTRPNTFMFGTSSNPFQGIGAYENGTTIKWLIKSGTALLGGQANSLSTGAISATAITFSDSTAIARFETIQGATIYAASGDGPRLTTDGNANTAFATARLGMPTYTDLICAGFVGRIWGAVNNSASSTFIQDQLYYSDVIPSTGVANTTGSGQYLKINTQGKWITGLVQFNNVLYVFTADSIFRVYNTQSVDNAPFANVGAIRQEAIIKTFDAVYFMHFSGIYKLDASGVTKVSQDIDDFIQRVNILIDSTYSTSYTRRIYSWFDEQSIFISIDYDPGWGGVSVDIDRTYVLRYNYIYKTWSIYTWQDFRIGWGASRFFSMNLNGVSNLANLTPLTLIVGQNLTNSNYLAGLYDIPTYYDGSKPMQSSSVGEPLGDWSDFTNSSTSSTNSRPIICNGETQWLNFGAENHQKTITGISIASENAAGFQIMYQIDSDDDQRSDRRNAVWKEIGTLSSDYMNFFLDFNSKPFYRIRFKVSGQTQGRQVSIGQITFLNITDLGYGKN